MGSPSRKRSSIHNHAPAFHESRTIGRWTQGLQRQTAGCREVAVRAIDNVDIDETESTMMPPRGRICMFAVLLLGVADGVVREASVPVLAIRPFRC